jgi:predicted DNA-binding transcriptional regulator YafY
MAKRRTPSPPKAAGLAGVTPERFTRLHRMVQLLAAGPQPRAALARRLHLDVRGFYRDLELLRAAGISVTLSEGRYGLAGGVQKALALLPFPDPHLTLGEVLLLAKGRSAAHAKLKAHIDSVLP